MGYAQKEMNKCKALTVPIYDTPKTLQQTIPIYQIAEDGIFLLEKKSEEQNKRFDKVYLFKDINYKLKNDMEKDSFIKQYCQLLNSMNVSYKITTMNNKRNMNQLERDVLIRVRDTDFKELEKNINDNITSSIQEGRNGIEQVKLFVITCERQNYEAARDYFRTVEANLMTNFNRMESGLIPLNATERLRYLHAFYRLGKEEEFSFDYKTAKKKYADFRNFICNLSLQHYADKEGRFDGKTLVYDDKYVRVLFAKDLPNSISDEFYAAVTGLSFHTITTLDVAPIPQEIAKKRLLEVYMNNERSIERQQEARNRARAYSTEISYDRRKQKEEIENYLDILTDNDERLSYMALYVVVIADSKKELESNVISISTTADNYSVKLEPAYWNQLPALNTALPIGVRYCNMMRPVFTQPLAAFVPFNVQELSHKNGLFYGINQISKNILVGDRRKLMNPHGFVFGITGAGKSVDVKCEMSQVVLAHPEDDVIVIDPQNEYVPLTASLKGQFIDISAKSNNHINPFDVSMLENYSTLDAFVADKTELMLGISEQILKHEITMGQKSLVDRCVGLLYKDYFSGEKGLLKKAKMPTMTDFYNLLAKQTEEEAKDLRLGFEMFVTGSLNFFAQQTNVDLKKKFVVYGTGGLGSNLNPIAQQIMLESIRARIAANYKKNITTWLYIDEFHNMVQGEFSTMYLVKIWKEVRKLGGICTGITQNIVDLLKNQEVATMLYNSQYISLLNQGEPELEVLSEILRLNGETLEYLRGADKGCGILRFGDKIFIPRSNRIPKNTAFYEMVNTNFYEKQAVKKKRIEKELQDIPEWQQAEAFGILN